MKNSGPIRVTAEQVDAYNAKQRVRRIEKAKRPKKNATPRRRDGEMGEKRCNQLVDWRSGEGKPCEIRIPGVCTGRGAEHHHRRLRSQGGLWLPSNIVLACSRCHKAVTNTNGKRKEYERNGWLVPSYADPATTPMFRAGEWVLLDNRGGWTATDTHEHKGAA